MIPIAAGESEFTRFDFRDLINHRAVDILQPDLAICGGITEARRIDALASAFNLQAGAASVGGGAGLLRRPPSRGRELVELHPRIFARRQSDAARSHRGGGRASKDGMIAIPDRPGLGITIREDVLAAHAVKVRMSEQRDLVSALALFFLQRKYEPGERVPSERELAERFKAGRGVVREALAYLEALRVIDRRAKSGIYMSNDVGKRRGARSVR